MKYSRFNELIECVKLSIGSVQKEFDDYQNEHFPQRSPEFFCLELNGEAGELANIEKKRWKGKHIPEERFAEEAADVLIALLNYSNSKKLDLANAVATKLESIENKRLELESIGESY